jgi:hypothetical protein
MGCDACLPIRTGYTVSFQKSNDVKKLENTLKIFLKINGRLLEKICSG